MNLGQLRAYFLQLLNRRDASANNLPLMNAFIQQSIVRTQRLLDTPADEVTLIADCDVVTDQLPIPPDYHRLLSITYDGRVLIEREETFVRELSKVVGHPQFYCRVNSVWYIAPAAPIGSIPLEVNYHADFSALVNDTDSNWLTNVASQAVVEGALALAFRFYMDWDRQQQWDASYQQTIGEINAEAAQAQLSNAVIAPGIDFSEGNRLDRYGVAWGRC